jgi:hypothetical protein
MSLEMHVLFSGKLPSKAALARTMKELGFPLAIPSSTGSLERHSGYLPMRLRREETGVEFDTFNTRSDVEDIAGGHDIDPRFDRSANFRWGGDATEMLAGLCGAAALAKLVNGVVLDDEEDRLLSADEAAASARRHVKSHLARAEPPSGTRPADLKRYLKPLLELRSDLVLVGRMLLVRPVRHILRGALFEPDGKYRFDVYPYIDALYQRRRLHGYEDRGMHPALWNVWQPHFQPLLVDCLRDEVFGWFGKITTLEDFAAQPFCTGVHRDARLLSLFLMSGRKRAADYVRQVERDESLDEFDKEDVRAQWKVLSGDSEAVCARFHAREKEAAQELKLDHIWEPSPFPVELPAAKRASRSAEPFFPADPWIPRPQSLLAEAPDAPGQIRYAKNWFRRGGRLVLAALLAPEVAQKRHRAHEAYTLLARLPDGLLFMINRNWGDRNEPPQFGVKPKPREALRAELHGRTHYAAADFRRRGNGIFELDSLFVHERSSQASVWVCHIDTRKNEKTIHAGDDDYTETSLTSAERDLALCELPAFGEYAALADRIRSLLRAAGNGSLT